MKVSFSVLASFTLALCLSLSSLADGELPDYLKVLGFETVEGENYVRKFYPNKAIDSVLTHEDPILGEPEAARVSSSLSPQEALEALETQFLAIYPEAKATHSINMEDGCILDRIVRLHTGENKNGFDQYTRIHTRYLSETSVLTYVKRVTCNNCITRLKTVTEALWNIGICGY